MTSQSTLREGTHTQLFGKVRKCKFIPGDDKIILSYMLGWQANGKEVTMTNQRLADELGMDLKAFRYRNTILNTTMFFQSERICHQYENGTVSWGKRTVVDEAAFEAYLDNPYDYVKTYNSMKKVVKTDEPVKVIRMATPPEVEQDPVQPVRVAEVTFERQEPVQDVADYTGGWDKKRFFKQLASWEKELRSTEDGKDMAPWAVAQEMATLYYTHIYKLLPTKEKQSEVVNYIYEYEENVIKKRVKRTA